MITFIIAGITVILLICVFFVTRSISRNFFEADRPDDTRKKQAIRIGRIVAGIIILLGVIGVVIQMNLRTCELPPVASIATPVCISGTVNIDGSTALQPLVKTITDDYTRQCPASTFNVTGTTSGEGLRHVEDGTDDVVIGNSDVQAPTTTYTDLEDHVVTAAIFCVIINNDIDVNNLSTNNLQDIYNGRITDWQQIAGGPHKPIIAFSRPAESGTRQAFQQYVLHGSAGLTSPDPIPTNQDIVKHVEDQPGAIAYASLNEVKTANSSKVRIVSIDGVPADAATVIDNSYHFWSIEHMYTKKGHAPALALHLIEYMNSPLGKRIALAHSYVNPPDLTKFSASDHCPSS